MKYCEICQKEFDTEETTCPVCGDGLVDVLTDEEAAVITATTLLM